MSARQRDARHGSRGSAPLEVLVMSAVVAFACLVALQIFSAMYAGQAASRAAWDAARAQSLGQNPRAAAEASLPGSVRVESISTSGDGVHLSVRTREFLPLARIGTITRSAYVP